MNHAIDKIAEGLERVDARIWAVAASLLLSVYVGFAVSVPNDDAFVYIRTAEIFQREGVAAAFDHFAWAGYSILIGLAGAAGFELITAAYLLNGLFFAILTYAFIGICREFSDDRALIALAALTILLFPEINEYRFQLLRDAGFWAFVTLGLWWLIRYGGEGGWKHCLCYCGALLMAAVFRPEAMLYLVAAPLCLLFDRRRGWAERYLHSFRAQGVAGAALLLCYLAGLAFDLDLFRQATAMGSNYAPFLQSLFDPSGGEMAAMAEAIFGEHAATYSGRYLPLFLLAGLMVILAAELMYAVGMPFSLILIWGYWKKWLLPDRDKALPIVAFAAINLLVVLAFLLVTRYLSSRYAMVFSLGLALAVPFTAREMLARAAPGTRFAPWLLVLFFVFSAVDSYYTFGRSKSYVGDAVEWLEANRGETARLLTNNRAVAYFSGMIAEYDQVQPSLSSQQILAMSAGDIIVVETSPAIEQLLSQPEIAELLTPTITLPNTQEPRMRIYLRPSGDSIPSTSNFMEETFDLNSSSALPRNQVISPYLTRDRSVNVDPLTWAEQLYGNSWSDFVEKLDLPEWEKRRVREMIIRHYALNQEMTGQYKDGLINLDELFSMTLTSRDLEQQLSSVLSPAQLELYWEHDNQLDRQFEVNREQIRQAFVDAGYTGILRFSNIGDWDTVQAYIDAGADVNMRPAGGESSPLHNAISHNNAEMVRALIDAGADVNWRDGDSIPSPLKWAASKGNVEIIRELVAAGADLEYHAPGMDGITALASAALSGREDAVRELLRLGADATGRAGAIALNSAARRGNQEIQQALFDAGASID